MTASNYSNERARGGVSSLSLTLLIRRRPLLLHPLLQRKQLLRPERLVMDLRGRLNQILEVRSRQKVAQVHKLAVILVLHIHHPPPILSSAHRLPSNNDTPLRANHRKRNNVLQANTSVHHPAATFNDLPG